MSPHAVVCWKLRHAVIRVLSSRPVVFVLRLDAAREAQQNRADAAMGLKTHSYHDAELEIVFGEEIERRASDAKFILETATRHGVPVEILWKPACRINHTKSIF